MSWLFIHMYWPLTTISSFIVFSGFCLSLCTPIKIFCTSSLVELVGTIAITGSLKNDLCTKKKNEFNYLNLTNATQEKIIYFSIGQVLFSNELGCISCGKCWTQNGTINDGNHECHCQKECQQSPHFERRLKMNENKHSLKLDGWH